MDNLLKKKAKQGFLWVLLERLLLRGIGLVKIPILAYLLSPDDFGLIGLITTITLLIKVITNTGFDTALIQKLDDVQLYLNTGWTLKVLSSLVHFLLIISLSKPVTRFYSEPRLEALFYLVACGVLIAGFSSIKLVMLTKKLEINKLTLYNTSVSTISSIIAIFLAFYFRNYWALGLAIFIENIIGAVGSYIIAPYRPTFDFDKRKIQELWSYGKWVLGAGIFLTLFMHADDLFVGKLLGITALGFYSMAYRLGNMATTELIDSFRKVLFPMFSALQNDIKSLKRVFIRIYQLSALLGGIVTLLLFLLSSEIATVFLGEKWLEVIPVLQIFAFWAGLQLLSTNNAPLFRAIGRPDLWTKVQGIKFGVLFFIIYPLSVNYGIEGTALAVLIASIVEFPFSTNWIKKITESTYLEILSPLVPPVLSVLIIALLHLQTRHLLLYNAPELLKLLVLGASYTMAYSLLVIVLGRLLNYDYIRLFKESAKL